MCFDAMMLLLPQRRQRLRVLMRQAGPKRRRLGLQTAMEQTADDRREGIRQGKSVGDVGITFGCSIMHAVHPIARIGRHLNR
jgi:hypothetical protein